MALSPKARWTFDRDVSIDERTPRALEHIAQYLDLIEEHLAKMAGTEDRPKDVKIIITLADIAEALKSKSSAST